MDTIVSKFGTVHCLVNCAGIGVACRTLYFGRKEEHKLELFDQILTVRMTFTLRNSGLLPSFHERLKIV